MLKPFSGRWEKSFFAVPPPGKLQAKLWNFFFFCDFQKGLAWCFILCGVRRGENGEGFFLSRGERYQGSNPQEALTWGKYALLGQGRNPPTFAFPRGGNLNKGTFPLTLSCFFSLCNGGFFSNTKKNCRKKCCSIQCQPLLSLFATHTFIKEIPFF